MSVDQKIFVDGHVGKLQLRKLVKEPDGFDDDTVELIWEHLDECEACVAEYEAVRADHQPDGSAPESASPVVPAVSDGALEPDLLDPDELESTSLAKPKKDDTHVNGLMPVGDDPARNGSAQKYNNGDRPSAVAVASDRPSEDAKETTTETKDAAENTDEPEKDDDGDKTDNRRPVIKAPKIEGLITGEVHELEVKPERLETEAPVDASDRLSKEEPRRDPETDDDEESSQESVSHEKKTRTAIDESPPAKEAVPEKAVTSRKPSVDNKPAPRPKPSKPTPQRAVPKVEKKSEPLEEALNKALALLARPRNALIAGGAVVVVAAAIIAAVILTGRDTERLIAGWEPLNVVETNVPLQEMIVRQMRRGRIPAASGPDVTLDFRGVDRLVIAVDLDFIKGKTTPHDVIVLNPDGLNVYQEPIPQLYLDDGRFFLRLVPDQFETGKLYKLELVTYRADDTMVVVAESVFDVMK